MSNYILYKGDKIINVVCADLDFVNDLVKKGQVDHYVNRDELHECCVLKVNTKTDEYTSFVSDPNSLEEVGVDFRDKNHVDSLVSKFTKGL